MKLQIHELKNLITKKMSKNLKTIALLAIVILAVSCKKEKQYEIVCKVKTIITGNDSIILSFNSLSNVTNINSTNVDGEINMDFINESGFHKQTITENGAAIPAITIYYTLNANGSIDRFQQIVTNPASVYVNNFRCKYDAEGHLILHELKVTKSGFPFSYQKDSMVYENGNMTKFFEFGSLRGDTTSASLRSTTLITYDAQNNTAGLYINQLMAPNNIEGTSKFYLNNFPYIFHLLGKGSKNLPTYSTTTFSSGGTGYSFSFNYTVDANNLVTSQTMDRFPANPIYPKTNRFYYECN